MAVDKNLFPYNLAVVAIMKNETPYAKEWIEYHLLAGVEHFYIYNNDDSPDALQEVLKPLIDAGLVTHIFYPGKARQYEAYNDAVQSFRFFCRYIAFIDTDEFIFPQENKSIVEVTDELLKDKPNAAGLGVNWVMYGSNNLETADYSKGLLQRFTARNAEGNMHIKTIADPRKIDFFCNPHFTIYFNPFHTVNENGGVIQGAFNKPPSIEKIRVNHYYSKSREEYEKKFQRGTADAYHNTYKMKNFDEVNLQDNATFDDSILKYSAARFAAGHGNIKPTDYQRVYNVLMQNLSVTLSKKVPSEIYQGQMETFLTCRKIAELLREKVLDDDAGNFLEEAALKAIYKTLFTNLTLADIKLLIAELPKILRLKYPAVEKIRKTCMNVIPKIMNVYRVYDPNAWREFVNLKYQLQMLETFDSYEHK